jgi:hypothetical protein
LPEIKRSLVMIEPYDRRIVTRDGVVITELAAVPQPPDPLAEWLAEPMDREPLPEEPVYMGPAQRDLFAVGQ